MKKDFLEKLNFFSASFTAILGISLAAEVIMENDVMDKIDDAALFVFGLFAIWWYRKSGKTSHVMSLVLIGVSLLIKIGAIIIEHADKEAVGDDYGIASTLLVALLFVSWSLFSARKQAK